MKKEEKHNIGDMMNDDILHDIINPTNSSKKTNANHES